MEKNSIIRLSPNEVDSVIKEETNKWRIFRIKQVREQAKEQASKIRIAVRKEENKQKELVKQKLEVNWLTNRKKKLSQLKQEYNLCISDVGQAHQTAVIQTEAESLEREKLTKYDTLAKRRGREAMKSIENRKTPSENDLILQRRKTVMKAERTRARKVAAKPVLRKFLVDKTLKPAVPKRVMLYEVGTFTTSAYVPKSIMVKKENPNSQQNANHAANEQRKILSELKENKAANDVLRAKMATQRSNKALKREKIKNVYTGVMKELVNINESELLHDLATYQDEEQSKEDGCKDTSIQVKMGKKVEFLLDSIHPNATYMNFSGDEQPNHKNVCANKGTLWSDCEKFDNLIDTIEHKNGSPESSISYIRKPKIDSQKIKDVRPNIKRSHNKLSSQKDVSNNMDQLLTSQENIRSLMEKFYHKNESPIRPYHHISKTKVICQKINAARSNQKLIVNEQSNQTKYWPNLEKVQLNREELSSLMVNINNHKSDQPVGPLSYNTKAKIKDVCSNKNLSGDEQSDKKEDSANMVELLSNRERINSFISNIGYISEPLEKLHPYDIQTKIDMQEIKDIETFQKLSDDEQANQKDISIYMEQLRTIRENIQSLMDNIERKNVPHERTLPYFSQSKMDSNKLIDIAPNEKLSDNEQLYQKDMWVNIEQMRLNREKIDSLMDNIGPLEKPHTYFTPIKIYSQNIKDEESNKKPVSRRFKFDQQKQLVIKHYLNHLIEMKKWGDNPQISASNSTSITFSTLNPSSDITSTTSGSSSKTSSSLLGKGILIDSSSLNRLQASHYSTLNIESSATSSVCLLTTVNPPMTQESSTMTDLNSSGRLTSSTSRVYSPSSETSVSHVKVTHPKKYVDIDDVPVRENSSQDLQGPQSLLSEPVQYKLLEIYSRLNELKKIRQELIIQEESAENQALPLSSNLVKRITDIDTREEPESKFKLVGEDESIFTLSSELSRFNLSTATSVASSNGSAKTGRKGKLDNHITNEQSLKWEIHSEDNFARYSNDQLHANGKVSSSGVSAESSSIPDVSEFLKRLGFHNDKIKTLIFWDSQESTDSCNNSSK